MRARFTGDEACRVMIWRIVACFLHVSEQPSESSRVQKQSLLLKSCDLWSLAGLLLVSCWFLLFPGSFSRIVRWCLSGVLVLFVELVFLVMSWWCLDGTLDWQSPWQSVFSGFWLGHTMHPVIATVPSCCHADIHDS